MEKPSQRRTTIISNAGALSSGQLKVACARPRGHAKASGANAASSAADARCAVSVWMCVYIRSERRVVAADDEGDDVLRALAAATQTWAEKTATTVPDLSATIVR